MMRLSTIIDGVLFFCIHCDNVDSLANVGSHLLSNAHFHTYDHLRVELRMDGVLTM